KHFTFEEAAAIPYGGLMALYFLRLAAVEPGQHIMVYGASGGIGAAAVQIAKHLGARVTAVCGPTNVDMVRSIGADAVLDYTKDTLPTGVVYDRVFDAVGRSKTSALKVAARNAVAAKGAFVSVDDKLPRLRRDDLALLTTLCDAGALK